MVDEERGKSTDSGVGMGLNKEAVSNKGYNTGIENGDGHERNSAGSSGNCLLTYGRRKRLKTSSNSEDKLSEECKFSTNSTTQDGDKITMEGPVNVRFPSSSCNQVNLGRMDSHTSRNGTDDFSVKDYKKLILEQMYQSFNEKEGSLQDCIRDALLFHREGVCASTETVHVGEAIHNGTLNASKDHVHATSNGLACEPSPNTNSDLCKRAFFNVLISTKFAELCDLLSGNFEGVKVNSLFDINLINSRIKGGVYNSSPVLFHSDIQQVWTKLEIVGTDLVALARSLSEKWRTSCCDEKILIQESNGHAKVEQAEDSCQHKAFTCKTCNEKTEGRDCLVCDHCEEVYHVLCTGPAVEKFPLKNWYCDHCRAKGIGSPHENCVLCEKINAPRSSTTGIHALMTHEEDLELEESSDDLEDDELENGTESLPPCCKICSIEIEKEKFRVCGHPFCPNKYYHERCLTVKQLDTYGRCWYCPSCICRGCLTDRDDDKIVLCDGCDQAFHIYCMQPPRTSIPRGRWFCTKCNLDLQRLHMVKSAYLTAEYKSRKKSDRGKGTHGNQNNVQKEKGEDLLDTSGGVDMLLTAAKTLNYEENLAAQRHKS